jgi:hypothetical protein
MPILVPSFFKFFLGFFLKLCAAEMHDQAKAHAGKDQPSAIKLNTWLKLKAKNPVPVYDNPLTKKRFLMDNLQACGH